MKNLLYSLHANCPMVYDKTILSTNFIQFYHVLYLITISLVSTKFSKTGIEENISKDSSIKTGSDMVQPINRGKSH